MLNPGKLAIATMVALAVGATAFSTWYHYQHAHRTHDFWGTETAVLIAQAPVIEVWRFGPSVPDSSTPGGEDELRRVARILRFGNRESYPVVAEKEATKARGMSNIRRALVLDTTFDWASQNPEAPKWQFAIDFRAGERSAVVLFDLDSHQVAYAAAGETLLLDPAASKEIREFFREQFDAKAE